jgi:predicted alpha/beta hydrolase family esterase
MKHAFNSRILILPGLGDSGEGHWQTHWEKQFGFKRVIQKDWNTPKCSDWIETIDNAITQSDVSNVILVAHSLACVTTVFWSCHYNRKIKGALLVAPSDVEADTYPPGTSGFSPMPLKKLPFPSITVASTNDYYVSLERAKLFADAWGSELINIRDAGHINVAAGFGTWESGLDYLRKLDSL